MSSIRAIVSGSTAPHLCRNRSLLMARTWSHSTTLGYRTPPDGGSTRMWAGMNLDLAIFVVSGQVTTIPESPALSESLDTTTTGR